MSLAMTAPAHATTTVATISGAYDACFYDTPCLVIHNSSGGILHNATLDLFGTEALNNGDTAHVVLGDLGFGDTSEVWGFLPGVSSATVPHNLTAYDYDDEWGFQASNPVCTINASLCAQVGNFKVVFNATIQGGPFDGMAVGSTFSPSHNFTGGFVPWEGLDAAGWSEDACCDVHSGSVSGTLAEITLGAKGVPEPATWSMMILGMGGLGAALRRRKATATA
jgi:hypothetical protein